MIIPYTNRLSKIFTLSKIEIKTENLFKVAYLSLSIQSVIVLFF